MNITKITIGRLYNLGSYEHIRYELTAEVPAGESPATAILGMERILAGLSPKTHTYSRDELKRERMQLDRMHRELAEQGPDEFQRQHGGFFGTPEEYLERCEESYAKNVAERDEWETRSARARKQLEDLGGAANWKDAKLDWEGDY